MRNRAKKGDDGHSTSHSVSQADLAILRAVERFHFLTAGQVSRLLYPGCHDENRYARRRLSRLVDEELLLRLRPLPTPRHGSAPHVFTLGRTGRQLLGVSQSYFRPAEEQNKARNHLFIEHTLATIDVLIAAELLCRTKPVTMPRLLTERELKRSPVRVSLPSSDGRPARSVAVIPDAWFELSMAGRRPAPIAVELDRDTEDQRRWRAKVAALAAWADGPYPQAFDAETLTIAVVTPHQLRRDALRIWTAEELDRIGQSALAEIFLFTSVDPVTGSPEELFFGRVWYEPTPVDPVSLLLLPPLASVPSVPVEAKEVWRAG